MFGSCSRTHNSRGRCGAALHDAFEDRRASAIEAARKNTHVISTRWNVTSACSGRRTSAGDGDAGPSPPHGRRHDVEAVQPAPDHERPVRAVPEAAHQEDDHQVQLRGGRARPGCRRAGCRDSRGTRWRATDASAAPRTRRPSSRGTAAGSSPSGRCRAPETCRWRCRNSRRSRSRAGRRRSRSRPAGPPATRTTATGRRRRRCREPIGDHHLLEQPPQHQLQPGDDARAAEGDRHGELVEEGTRPFDRPGEQLREERDVQQQPADVPLGGQLAAVTRRRGS